ncbi:MAG: hypothetical protein H7070_07505 [Saprospiraceae bacterium]|nr:hypothetical protein [Pyrinomonadaceae bacterium]
MQSHKFRGFFSFSFTAAVCFLLMGCGAQPGTVNVNLTNSNANIRNSTANTVNSNSANTNTISSAPVETREPEQYQANVTVKLEGIGDQQRTAFPPLTATVARSGADRRMQFTMPAGGRVVYLDKAGTNYLVLPEKKQYAELNRESLGFEVRRLMMPEQIVQQVKNMQGVEKVGEEKYNGRDVIKYRYGAVANTQSQAGQVGTESFLLVDKETGLPLRSETISQSQSGGNVQGYNGVKIITEITDIKMETTPDLFAEPTEFQKIESDQVRSQVDMIFNTVATFLVQMMKQSQAAASPVASPAR